MAGVYRCNPKYGSRRALRAGKTARRLPFGTAAYFIANKKQSEDVVRRRIRLHLLPYFGARRLISITSADVTAYVAKRQKDFIVTRKARVLKLTDGTEQTIPEERKSVRPAEINRELQVLKRIFSLAIQSGRIARKPAIKMLREAPARAGFFESEQYRSVLSHLPAELRPVITFAYITGWRLYSEVLPLEWRQVDFDGGEIRRGYDEEWRRPSVPDNG